MINKPITLEQLRKDLVDMLEAHNMTIEQFQAMDIDDIDNWDLRDLKLIIKGLDLGGN
jgi:hypothetical protein